MDSKPAPPALTSPFPVLCVFILAIFFVFFSFLSLCSSQSLPLSFDDFSFFDFTSPACPCFGHPDHGHPFLPSLPSPASPCASPPDRRHHSLASLWPPLLCLPRHAWPSRCGQWTCPPQWTSHTPSPMTSIGELGDGAPPVVSRAPCWHFCTRDQQCHAFNCSYYCCALCVNSRLRTSFYRCRDLKSACSSDRLNLASFSRSWQTKGVSFMWRLLST